MAKTTREAEEIGWTKLPRFPGTQNTDRLGSLRCNENIRKSRRFNKQSNNFAANSLHLHHTFWYISLPFLFYTDCHVKFPNFTFEGGRKRRQIFLSHLNLESSSKNPTVGKFLFLCLLRGHICVAYDNAWTLNCYKLLGTFIFSAINERTS